MKYPKEWVSRLCNYLQSRYDNSATEQAEAILNALSQLGALKEPPKPREWFICSKCKIATPMNEVHTCFGNFEYTAALIHVREVIDE